MHWYLSDCEYTLSLFATLLSEELQRPLPLIIRIRNKRRINHLNSQLAAQHTTHD